MLLQKKEILQDQLNKSLRELLTDFNRALTVDQRNNCLYVDLFQDIESRTKFSASNTLLSEARLETGNKQDNETMRKRPVIVKIGFEPLENNTDNSLAVENAIYDLMLQLRQLKYTPHVSISVAVFECDNFLDTLGTMMMYNRHAFDTALALHENWAKFSKLYNLQKMRALVTELAPGIDLSSLVRNLNQNSLKDLKTRKLIFETVYAPILFQIFYTLAVFEQVGLQHNDLHTGNVIVMETSPDPTLTEYQVETQKFLVNTRYFAHIIDFDRATKVRTSFMPEEYTNKPLDTILCKLNGQCNELMPAADAFRVCHFLHLDNNAKRPSDGQAFPNPFLDKFLKRHYEKYLFSPAKVKDTRARQQKRQYKKGDQSHPGSLCMIRNNGDFACEMVKDWQQLPTAKQILLEDPDFKRLFSPTKTLSNQEAEYKWALPSSFAPLSTNEKKIEYPAASSFIEWLFEVLEERNVPYEKIDTGGDFYKIRIGKSDTMELDWKHLDVSEIQMFSQALKPFDLKIVVRETPFFDMFVSIESFL